MRVIRVFDKCFLQSFAVCGEVLKKIRQRGFCSGLTKTPPESGEQQSVELLKFMDNKDSEAESDDNEEEGEDAEDELIGTIAAGEAEACGGNVNEKDEQVHF